MKRLFKKNQVIITALAIMVAAAGYLNYSGRLFPEDRVEEASSELASQELLDISEEDLEASSGDIESTDDEGEENEIEGTPGEAVLTNGVVAEAKVAREQVRAKNKESLLEIIDNANVTEEQKKDAIAQMLSMTELAEKEVAIETMLSSKGFSNAVVTLTEEGADVVLNNADLTEANRAQIEDIVTRKAQIAPEHIVITPMFEKKEPKKEEK